MIYNFLYPKPSYNTENGINNDLMLFVSDVSIALEDSLKNSAYSKGPNSLPGFGTVFQNLIKRTKTLVKYIIFDYKSGEMVKAGQFELKKLFDVGNVNSNWNEIGGSIASKIQFKPLMKISNAKKRAPLQYGVQ